MKVLIVLFFSMSLTFASIRKPRLSTHYQARVNKISKEIDGLERQLGKKNSRYLKLVEKRKYLENKTIELKSEVFERAIKMKDHIKSVKKAMALNVLHDLEHEKNAEQIMAQLALKNILDKRLKRFKNDLEETKKLQKLIKQLELKIEEYYGIETSLLSLINRLEQQKLTSAQQYKQNQKELKKLRRKKYKGRSNMAKVIGKFDDPMRSFVKKITHKKGVNYLFKRSRPIHAVRDGKISYTGNLATFGQVLMLDHGKETRSVIFGPFSTDLKKGQSVKKGQIIGQTKANSGKLSEINFGIWYKNKAQYTANLLKK